MFDCATFSMGKGKDIGDMVGGFFYWWIETREDEGGGRGVADLKTVGSSGWGVALAHPL